MNKKFDDSDASGESDKEEENFSLIKDLALFPKRMKIAQNSALADGETFEKIKKMLTCPICMEIFKDPVYIKDCSHRFCKSCIEKSIRLGKIKSCPSCRKSIGTKRMLRIDNNIISIMLKIFDDINQYMKKENELEQREILRIYGMNIRDSGNANGLKRGRNKIETNMEISSTILAESSELKDKPRKKRKANVPTNSINEISEQIMEEINLGETEEDLETLKMLEKFVSMNPNATLNLDWIINIKLEVLPTEIFLSQIKKNIFRCHNKLTLLDISKAICLKLNMNCNKHCERIKLWIKENDNKMIELDQKESLKTINTNYWKNSIGLRLYDTDDFYKAVLDRSKLIENPNRILYYSLDCTGLF